MLQSFLQGRFLGAPHDSHRMLLLLAVVDTDQEVVQLLRVQIQGLGPGLGLWLGLTL